MKLKCDKLLLTSAFKFNLRRYSTVGEEKAHNPRLGLARTQAEFAEIMAGLNLPYPKKIDEAMPRNMVCGIQVGCCYLKPVR